MLTIVADTCGRHDTLGGACAAESNTVRYALQKKFMHSCRDNYLIALQHADIGLGKRDLVPNINFFMNVPVTDRRRPQVRRRRVRPRQVRGDARRDGPVGADQQLPAAQQPLQRLQPDAHSTAGLGPGLTPFPCRGTGQQDGLLRDTPRQDGLPPESPCSARS
jgi:hypothetical protein